MNAGDYSFGYANRLRLDPDIEASIEAMKMQINYNKILSASRRMDLGLIQNQEQKAWVKRGPDCEIEKGIMPRTPNLELPRQGTMGDVFSALLSTPQVKAMIDELERNLIKFAREYWESSTPFQKSLMMTGSTALAAGILAEIIGRGPDNSLTLQFISERNFKVTDEISVMVQPIGDDKKFMITIDVGALLNKYAPKSKINKFFQGY
jgi:hypothetical protein